MWLLLLLLLAAPSAGEGAPANESLPPAFVQMGSYLIVELGNTVRVHDSGYYYYAHGGENFSGIFESFLPDRTQNYFIYGSDGELPSRREGGAVLWQLPGAVPVRGMAEATINYEFLPERGLLAYHTILPLSGTYLDGEKIQRYGLSGKLSASPGYFIIKSSMGEGEFYLNEKIPLDGYVEVWYADRGLFLYGGIIAFWIVAALLVVRHYRKKGGGLEREGAKAALKRLEREYRARRIGKAEYGRLKAKWEKKAGP